MSGNHNDINEQASAQQSDMLVAAMVRALDRMTWAEVGRLVVGPDFNEHLESHMHAADAACRVIELLLEG